MAWNSIFFFYFHLTIRNRISKKILKEWFSKFQKRLFWQIKTISKNTFPRKKLKCNAGVTTYFLTSIINNFYISFRLIKYEVWLKYCKSGKDMLEAGTIEPRFNFEREVHYYLFPFTMMSNKKLFISTWDTFYI